MKEYGLVFSGGGTRGAYEIGTWKAFNELGLKFKAVAGTSIGAINSALFAQGDYDIAYNLWTNTDIVNFMNYEESNAVSLFVRAVKDKGLDISPLKNLLLKYIDEDKIRKSDIDYGLVTYSVTNMKPVMLNKKDIPKGKLIDYIIASASHPMFKLKEIDGVKYIDGGVYDNMPISLAVKSGVKDVICVDASSGLGKTQSYTKDDFNLDSLTLIKYSGSIGRVLDFNLSMAKSSINMGYLDTMKCFNKYSGVKYYFKTDTINDSNSYMNPLKDEELIKILDMMELGDANSTRAARFSIMRHLYKYCDGKLTMKTILPACLEIAAEIFEIERLKTYTMDELLDIVLKEYQDTLRKIKFTNEGALIKGKFKALEFNNINKKNLVTYLIDLSDKHFNNKKLLIQFLPKVFITYTFLNIMFERKKNTALD